MYFSVDDKEDCAVIVKDLMSIESSNSLEVFNNILVDVLSRNGELQTAMEEKNEEKVREVAKKAYDAAVGALELIREIK